MHRRKIIYVPWRKEMRFGEYESLIKVLAGMGGNRTTDELKQAMMARGLSVENVEELLDIAVGKHDVLDTYDGTTFRYRCQTDDQISPSVFARRLSSKPK